MIRTSRELALGMQQICSVCQNTECRGHIISKKSTDGIVIILGRRHENCKQIVQECEIFQRQYPLWVNGDLTGI